MKKSGHNWPLPWLEREWGYNHEHDSLFKAPGILDEVDGLAWRDVDMHCREFTLPNIKKAKRARSYDTRRLRVFYPSDGRRRLDTKCVFLYKDKPTTDVALDKACSLAGIRTLGVPIQGNGQHEPRAGRGTTAMKIVGRKSERKDQRYNTVGTSLRRPTVDDV